MEAPYRQIDMSHLCSTSILSELIITILLREHRGSERLCGPAQGHMALVSGRAGIRAQASLIPKSAVSPITSRRLFKKGGRNFGVAKSL